MGALPSDLAFTDNGNGTATLAGTPQGRGRHHGQQHDEYADTIEAVSARHTGQPNVPATVNDPAAVTPSFSSGDATASLTLDDPNSFTVAMEIPIAALPESAIPQGLLSQMTEMARARSAVCRCRGRRLPFTITANNGVDVPQTQVFVLDAQQAASTAVTPAISGTRRRSRWMRRSRSRYRPPHGGGHERDWRVAVRPGLHRQRQRHGDDRRHAAGRGRHHGQQHDQYADDPAAVTPAYTSADATAFTVDAPDAFTVATNSYPTAGALSESGAMPGVIFTDNGNGTGTFSGTPLSWGRTPPSPSRPITGSTRP